MSATASVRQDDAGVWHVDCSKCGEVGTASSENLALGKALVHEAQHDLD